MRQASLRSPRATAVAAAIGAALLALAAPAGAWGEIRASPTSDRPADLPPFQYRVRAGDNLRAIARAYLLRADDYRVVQQVNGMADANHVAVGHVLAIPRGLLRTGPLFARIVAFRGTVKVGAARAVRVGLKVGEHDRIETGANSSVSFLFADGSNVTLPSQSIIVIDRLRRILISGEQERIFRLEAGRSLSGVTPSKGPGSSFRIETPVSVAAVRGTNFRVSVAADGKAATSEVLKGVVGIGGAGGAIALPAGYGARSTPTSAGAPIALLPAPRIVSPVRRQADGTSIFTVSAVPGAVRYRVQVASDAAFLKVRQEAVSDTPAVAIAGLADGVYFVRATAIDVNDLEGLPGAYTYEHR